MVRIEAGGKVSVTQGGVGARVFDALREAGLIVPVDPSQLSQPPVWTVWGIEVYDESGAGDDRIEFTLVSEAGL